MSKKKLALIKEPDGVRGLVPSREEGIKDRVFGAFLDKLDPRHNEEIQLALAASPDPRFQEFLRRIGSAKFSRVSIQTIAKACDISLEEFRRWHNRECVQLAVATIQQGMVKVSQDIVQDAQARLVVCERCDDLGFIAAPPGLPADTAGYKQIDMSPTDPKFIRTCPNCDGKGRIRKPGDSAARDKMLEISGMVKKGPMVSITQNLGGASHASAVPLLNDAIPVSFDKVDD